MSFSQNTKKSYVKNHPEKNPTSKINQDLGGGIGVLGEGIGVYMGGGGCIGGGGGGWGDVWGGLGDRVE